jgi:hypothetical protein
MITAQQQDTLLQCLETLQYTVHDTWAVPRGWWTCLETGKDLTVDYPNGERPEGSKAIGEITSLIHTEVSEAYEGHRRNKQDEHCPEFLAIEVELADAMIRIFDAAGGLHLRLAEAFVAKMRYNFERPDHSMAARKQEGGKKT